MLVSPTRYTLSSAEEEEEETEFIPPKKRVHSEEASSAVRRKEEIKTLIDSLLPAADAAYESRKAV